jgi:hypothetical protein
VLAARLAAAGVSWEDSLERGRLDIDASIARPRPTLSQSYDHKSVALDCDVNLVARLYEPSEQPFGG